MSRKIQKRLAPSEGVVDKPLILDRQPGTVPIEAQRSTLLHTLIIAAIITMTLSVAFAQKGVAPSPSDGLPPGPMQAKAIASCEDCHEARIIVQQRLSKAAWTKEVDKMIKWGAVVDASDHDPLIDYLNLNFGVDKPPYEPQRTSPDKAHTSKVK